MDTYMLCLANSYKHGGRCVAGIEIGIGQDGKPFIKKKTSGTPRWIRPISHSAAGEVPLSQAHDIHIMSIVKIEGYTSGALDDAHQEDIYYQRLVTIEKLRPTETLLSKLVDTDPAHRLIFGNRGKAVTPENFQFGSYSIMLIRSNDTNIYLDTRFGSDTRSGAKWRAKFEYENNTYDLPITDPGYLDKLKYDDDAAGQKQGLYLVLSLGVEHEGWHSKLVATIIEPMRAENVTKNRVASAPVAQAKTNSCGMHSTTTTPKRDSLINPRSISSSDTSRGKVTAKKVQVPRPIPEVSSTIKIEAQGLENLQHFKTTTLNELTTPHSCESKETPTRNNYSQTYKSNVDKKEDRSLNIIVIIFCLIVVFAIIMFCLARI